MVGVGGFLLEAVEEKGDELKAEGKEREREERKRRRRLVSSIWGHSIVYRDSEIGA